MNLPLALYPFSAKAVPLARMLPGAGSSACLSLGRVFAGVTFLLIPPAELRSASRGVPWAPLELRPLGRDIVMSSSPISWSISACGSQISCKTSLPTTLPYCLMLQTCDAVKLAWKLPVFWKTSLGPDEQQHNLLNGATETQYGLQLWWPWLGILSRMPDMYRVDGLMAGNVNPHLSARSSACFQVGWPHAPEHRCPAVTS